MLCGPPPCKMFLSTYYRYLYQQPLERWSANAVGAVRMTLRGFTTITALRTSPPHPARVYFRVALAPLPWAAWVAVEATPRN